jgi:hypothetical protein
VTIRPALAGAGDGPEDGVLIGDLLELLQRGVRVNRQVRPRGEGEVAPKDGRPVTGLDVLQAHLFAGAAPQPLAWGIGVGICSSVIPYGTDPLAMARRQEPRLSLRLQEFQFGLAPGRPFRIPLLERRVLDDAALISG